MVSAQITTALVQGETFKAVLCGVPAEVTAVTCYVRGGPSGTQLYQFSATLADGVWTAEADTGAFGGPPQPWGVGAYAVEVWSTGPGATRALLVSQRLDVAASAQFGGAGFSALNQYEQIVQAIEAHLRGAGNDPTWRRYRINNREMERYSTAELLRLLGHYKRLAAIERRKQKGQSVLGPDIRFRF